MEKIKKFVFGFFESIGCDVTWEKETLAIKNVPTKFENHLQKKAPYNLVFDSTSPGDFAGKGSNILDKILQFLKQGSKTSILSIDFTNIDNNILKKLKLQNCEIESVNKKFQDHFFTRFSFVVNFNYLNKSDKIIEEIFIHNGQTVNGDLNGYTIIDGEKLPTQNRYNNTDKTTIKQYYDIATKTLNQKILPAQNQLIKNLQNKIDKETSEIENYYNTQLNEFGGTLADKIKKIQDLELRIRTGNEEEKNILLTKLNKLKKDVAKIGDNDIIDKIDQDKNKTVEDIRQKFSLSIDKKLVNTTIIHYPIFFLKIYLKEHKKKRLIDIQYNPLTDELSNLECESCQQTLNKINLCSNGHLTCDKCISTCGECKEEFCKKCLERKCSFCDKKLCKKCIQVCRGCGKTVCNTHLETDCVSGEKRCLNCMQACSACNNFTQKKFLTTQNASTICQKCLGAQQRNNIIKQIFHE